MARCQRAAIADAKLAGLAGLGTLEADQEPALLQRLSELVSLLVPPPAAAVQEGAATMVPAPDPGLAAGGERRAA